MNHTNIIETLYWQRIEEDAMDACVKSKTGDVGIVSLNLPSASSKKASLQQSKTVLKSAKRYKMLPTMHLADSDNGGIVAVLIPGELRA